MGYVMLLMGDVYMIKIIRVHCENTSDPENFWGSNGIRTYDLGDTGTKLYQLSYEALLEAGQVRVQFIHFITL